MTMKSTEERLDDAEKRILYLERLCRSLVNSLAAEQALAIDYHIVQKEIRAELEQEAKTEQP